MNRQGVLEAQPKLDNTNCCQPPHSDGFAELGDRLLQLEVRKPAFVLIWSEKTWCPFGGLSLEPARGCLPPDNRRSIPRRMERCSCSRTSSPAHGSADSTQRGLPRSCRSRVSARTP